MPQEGVICILPDRSVEVKILNIRSYSTTNHIMY